MKSAKEILDELSTRVPDIAKGERFADVYLTEKLVQWIQADALEVAALECERGAEAAAKSELRFAFECSLAHRADAGNIRKLKPEAQREDAAALMRSLRPEWNDSGPPLDLSHRRKPT